MNESQRALEHSWSVRRAKAREFARRLAPASQNRLSLEAAADANRLLGHERPDFTARGPKARVPFALELNPVEHKRLKDWDYQWEGSWVRQVEIMEKTTI